MKKYTPEHIKISDQVIAYLQENPILSKNKIEKLVGAHQAQLSNKVISDKILFKTVKLLGKYGFKLDGFSIVNDDNSNCFFLEKNIDSPTHLDEDSTYSQKKVITLICEYADLYNFMR